MFSNNIDSDIIKSIDVKKNAFKDIAVDTLIDWLVDEKAFNKKRLVTRFAKNGLSVA